MRFTIVARGDRDGVLSEFDERFPQFSRRVLEDGGEIIIRFDLRDPYMPGDVRGILNVWMRNGGIIWWNEHACLHGGVFRGEVCPKCGEFVR